MLWKFFSWCGHIVKEFVKHKNQSLCSKTTTHILLKQNSLTKLNHNIYKGENHLTVRNLFIVYKSENFNLY